MVVTTTREPEAAGDKYDFGSLRKEDMGDRVDPSLAEVAATLLNHSLSEVQSLPSITSSSISLCQDSWLQCSTVSRRLRAVETKYGVNMEFPMTSTAINNFVVALAGLDTHTV